MAKEKNEILAKTLWLPMGTPYHIARNTKLSLLWVSEMDREGRRDQGFGETMTVTRHPDLIPYRDISMDQSQFPDLVIDDWFPDFTLADFLGLIDVVSGTQVP